MSGAALERLGFPPRQKERSFWVLGDDRAAFEAASAVIDGVAERYPRLRIVLSGPGPLRPWLAARFPRYIVHAAPLSRSFAVRRFVRRANFRAVAALEAFPMTAAQIAGCADEGLTLVTLSGRPDGLRPGAEVAAAAEADVVVGEDAGRFDLESAIDILGEMLARDIKVRRKRARKTLSPSSLLLSAIRSPAGRNVLGGRLRRISGAAELRAALGEPETIMCLGNGPSSEDPRLNGFAYDALFRVNHSWRERGFLARPDVVFTGGAKTMATLDGVIFGVQSEGAERRLVGARFFSPRRGATRFFRVPEVAPRLAAYPWGPVRPTNGAAMVAAAAALRPRRLIVAGIDMFRHPEGAYPGDAATPNAFAPAHDAEAELDFLLDVFEDFQGELSVVGDVLLDACQRRSPARSVVSRLPKDGGAA